MFCVLMLRIFDSEIQDAHYTNLPELEKRVKECATGQGPEILEEQ